MNKIKTKEFPFIGWVEFKKPNNEPYGDLGVYLINPTDKTYEKVEMFCGMFAGDTDSLLETSKMVKNLGSLKPHSSIKIDAMTWYDLDFVFWYHLDFFKNSNEKPECYWFEIIKAYAWKKEEVKMLPVFNKKGMKIILDPRGKEPIQEEIKTAHMESRYTESK